MAKDEFDMSMPEGDEAPNAKAMNEVKQWIDEVQAAEKREHKWRQEGRTVICLYEADRKVDYQFNILYSNTETLAPALYSTTPTPVVQRRFKDEDPVGLEASKVIQRTLAFSLDNGQAIYASFDTLMIKAVQSALVPGRGVTRYKYDAEIVKETPVAPEDKNDIDSRPEMSLPGTVESEISSGEKIKWESVCGEPIQWDRFCHGYGQTWQDVPWVAYKWPMTREECIKNFGHEIGSQVLVSSVSDKELDNEKDQSSDMMRGMKIAWVYEIWNKATKEVVFVSEGYKDAPLKKVPDPLGLTGFFSCPEPLTFFQRVSSLLPQTLYAFYEEQAKELNQVTARIGRLTKALKVRGIYDGSIDALGRIFEQDDNALIAADNTAAMYDRGGIEKAIWLLPIDKIITVLQQLYLNRQQSKQVIYEITGLSDILRGTSNPNETLGAQKIKDQWGNLRLRKLQKRVQSYAVDSLRIMAEIACTKFGLETLKQITNLKYPSQAEKQALQQRAMMAQQAQQPLPPKAEDALSLPSWEEIESILQDNLQRSYRIDIESNSTIEPEATEDKESMMGLMNALSQFLLGVQPLVEDGSLPFDAMRAIMLTIARRFNFGDQVEDELKKMKAPEPKPQEPTPEMLQAQKDLESGQQKLQQDQASLDQAKLQLDNDSKSKEMDLKFKEDQARMGIQFDQKEAEMEIDFAKREALMEIQMTKKEAETEVQTQVKTGSMSLQSEVERANLQHSAKEESIGKKEGEFKEKETKVAQETQNAQLIQALQGGQTELANAMAKMAESLGQLAKSHSAPKTISDGTKSYTVKSGE